MSEKDALLSCRVQPLTRNSAKNINCTNVSSGHTNGAKERNKTILLKLKSWKFGYYILSYFKPTGCLALGTKIKIYII